jgi:hypothetical protein
MVAPGPARVRSADGVVAPAAPKKRLILLVEWKPRPAPAWPARLGGLRRRGRWTCQPPPLPAASRSYWSGRHPNTAHEPPHREGGSPLAPALHPLRPLPTMTSSRSATNRLPRPSPPGLRPASVLRAATGGTMRLACNNETVEQPPTGRRRASHGAPAAPRGTEPPHPAPVRGSSSTHPKCIPPRR